MQGSLPLADPFQEVQPALHHTHGPLTVQSALWSMCLMEGKLSIQDNFIRLVKDKSG